MKPYNPNDEEMMTPEEVNKSYFICPNCNSLAEKHFLEKGLIMCTQCGSLVKDDEIK